MRKIITIIDKNTPKNAVILTSVRNKNADKIAANIIAKVNFFKILELGFWKFSNFKTGTKIIKDNNKIAIGDNKEA